MNKTIELALKVQSCMDNLESVKRQAAFEIEKAEESVVMAKAILKHAEKNEGTLKYNLDNHMGWRNHPKTQVLKHLNTCKNKIIKKLNSTKRNYNYFIRNQMTELIWDAHNKAIDLAVKTIEEEFGDT